MNKAVGVNALNKKEVSTKEIVQYLESVDSENEQIIFILQKKPVYPEYKKLPWYLSVCEDKVIIKKLKLDKRLATTEKVRLRETLEAALLEVKKLQRWQREKAVASGLESYIKLHLGV